MATNASQEYGVVVVSYDSKEALVAFLHSLRTSSSQPEHVVVVENGPVYPKIPKQKYPMTVLHRPDNPGYGSAVNLGVELLPSNIPWVLISNPDVIVHSETTAQLIAVGNSELHVGSLGPALLNHDGTIYPSARAVPTLSTGIGHSLLAAVWPKNPWTVAYRGSYGTEAPRQCGWLSGACVMVNRAAFESIGGFDTGYFMYMEDVDLGVRLSTAGYKNVYVPRAKATHEGGHATAQTKGSMTKAHHDSAKRFIAMRYPGVRNAPVRLLINAGLAVRQRVVDILRQRDN